MKSAMWLIGYATMLLFVAPVTAIPDGAVRRLDGSLVATDEIDAVVTELMEAANVTGLCLAILNDGEPRCIRAFGYRDRSQDLPLDTDSVMMGASFSKAVFAYIVMQLVQESVLELDRPVADYLEKPLPDYAGYEDLAADDQWRSITVRHCLSHTTGFPNLRRLNPHGNNKLEIFFTPGSRYSYSGEGINLLQLIVEHVTGRGIEELARERVFVPLGMTRTSYLWQDRFRDNYAVGHDITGFPYAYKHMTEAVGGGSLLTSISDYAMFVTAVMHGDVLDRGTRSEMLSPTIRIRSQHQFPVLTDDTTDRDDAIELSYGLGWGLFRSAHGRAFFKEGHGSGFQNYNVNFENRQTSIVIMTNSDNGESIFRDLLARTIGDTDTPWEWERYIPYQNIEPRPIGVYLYDIILLQGSEEAVAAYRRLAESRVRDRFIFGEDQLNSLGYQMIKEGNLDAAIAMFELNVSEYPGSANAYDSCGEAYMLAGRTDQAVASYTKSLELDPGNDNAREMLTRIREGE